MNIAHITFDYPDEIDSNKTKAVFNLVNTQDVNLNYIFSLNRTKNPFADFSPIVNGNVVSMRIYGWPYGLGLSVWMNFAARKIQKVVEDKKLQIDLIHAHKVTFEGLIARQLSKSHNYPFIVTFRGDTDTKLFKYKYFSRVLFQKVLDEARNVIVLAPWTFDVLAKVWRKDKKSMLVPNIIQLADTQSHNTKSKNTFVSVFNLDVYKRKNITRVINAFDQLHRKHPHLKLDIIGGGDDTNIRKVIETCQYPENFKLLGKMEHENVLDSYSKYAGFILPSYPETFGMVFIEALNAGIPVIYAKNSGIDGYFENGQVGEGVNHSSTEDIAVNLLKVYNNNAAYTQRVLETKNNGLLKQFSSRAVGQRYSEILNKALSTDKIAT